MVVGMLPEDGLHQAEECQGCLSGGFQVVVRARGCAVAATATDGRAVAHVRVPRYRQGVYTRICSGINKVFAVSRIA